jgi:hypothetical protein
MNFEIGDVVYICRNTKTDTTPLLGKVGYVKFFKGGSVGVEFGENIGGHDLDGHCEKPYGYWMKPHDIQKMEPLTILLQKQWVKEWEPKLRKKMEQTDSVVILEE